MHGHNKNLVPPPLDNEENFTVDVVMDITRILLIDEIEKFMRFSYFFQKQWFNSYITFQNLKNDTVNLIFPEDRETMYMPYLSIVNLENEDKCKKTDFKDFISILPNEAYEYEYNGKENFQNAFLFQVFISFLF